MENKLKYYRVIVNGMTIQELHKKSGVSASTISDLERHPNRAVTTRTLTKLAAALGESVERIFFGASV